MSDYHKLQIFIGARMNPRWLCKEESNGEELKTQEKCKTFRENSGSTTGNITDNRTKRLRKIELCIHTRGGLTGDQTVPGTRQSGGEGQEALQRKINFHSKRGNNQKTLRCKKQGNRKGPRNKHTIREAETPGRS